jgi:hypothetical protein
MKSISPIHFIDKLIKKNELGQPFRLTDHQREILRLAFAFDSEGRLPYDTILYRDPTQWQTPDAEQSFPSQLMRRFRSLVR